ncbi:reverse transcriptase domain-containing protein [Tanacetum coccineum]
MQTSAEVTSPRVSLALVETRSRRPGNEPMQLDDMEERRQLDKGKKLPKSSIEEKIVVNDNYPEQLVTIGADMTGIPRAITEHSLNTYPHIEPKVQKKRSLAPYMRKVVTDEVNEWLKAGIVRRVRYPLWVSNLVLVKKVDRSWRMCIDFKDLNKAYAYKGYHQIHMTKKDEENTAFHTEEGVFCYTKIHFGLKNAGATYQRLVDFVFKEQIGVNLESYVDDVVIKSRTKQDIIKDIEQTFSTLRRINMKLNLKKFSFGMEEGKFLGYIVDFKGIRANPEKTKAYQELSSRCSL